MILNSNNIEDLIFRNSEIIKKLPAYLTDLVKQWQLGQLVPGLRAMAQKAKLDFLNKLTESDILLLREFFPSLMVNAEKLDYTLIKNHTMPIFTAIDTLGSNIEMENFCISRDGNLLYICSW